MLAYAHLGSLAFRVFVVGMALTVSSCSSSSRKLHPVKGKVLVAGKPAAGANVIFHPKDTAGKDPVVPRGRVGLDGVFVLTTYEKNDGAPTGSYAVTVSWMEAPEVSDEDGKLLVNRRYLDPKTSGLSAEVKAGANELPPFELSK